MTSMKTSNIYAIVCTSQFIYRNSY